MKIGIDIDDTLVSTSESFDEVVKKYNLDFKKKFKDTWTKEEKNFIFDNYLKEILMNAKLKENAKEVVNYLNDLGHKLVIITARGNKHCDGIEEFTKDFIELEKINISEIYFGEYKKSDLEYTIDNPSIASIDEKLIVHGLEEGSTIIQIRTKDQKYEIDCTVIVTKT